MRVHAEVLAFQAGDLPLICRALAAADAGLAAVLDSCGPPPMWSREPGLATLMQIILEQQVSLASAAACWQKLLAKLGSPDPEAVLSLDDDGFRQAGVSRQKARYLRSLCTAVATGSLDIGALGELPDETVIRQLTAVKGIGAWTADVYLMMALHRYDRFPAGDVALLQSMREHLYGGEKVGVEDLLHRAALWRPHRSVAAFLLWHAYLRRRGRRYETIPS